MRIESEGTSPESIPREPGRARRTPGHLLFWSSPTLDDLEPEILARADAVVFAWNKERPSGAGPPLLESAPAAGARSETIEAKLFQSWGPDLALVLHPWQPADNRALELSRLTDVEGRDFRFRLPTPETATQLAAVELTVPVGRKRDKPPRVWLGEKRLEILSVSSNRKRRVWTTDRFPLDPGIEAEIGIRLPPSVRIETLEANIRLWNRSR